MKKILSILFALGIFSTAIALSGAAFADDLGSGSNPELAVDTRMQETLDTYFQLRNDMLSAEKDLSEAECTDILSSISNSPSVNSKMAERLSAPENLARYHGVHVVYSQVSTAVQSVKTVGPSTFELKVYEWTWIEYNDGKGGPTDEMGYGTDHTMTLERGEDGAYLIVEDIYDDSAIVGPRDTAAEPPRSTAYTVAKGDCLWTIAARLLGSGYKWTDLYETNRGIISNPNLIYVGQVLEIPVVD